MNDPNPTPRAIRVAFVGFVVALLAGVVEAIAQTALAAGDTHPGSLATALTVRLTIYLVVFAAALRMTYGSRWARRVLAVGIGIVGLASLLIEPLAQALSADQLGDLFTDVTTEFVLIFVLRTIHVLAVLVAVPAMYYRTRAYFRTSARS
ncbi:hypothetical protein [Nocardia callitridis]|uniref:hypothetical protein n=1 Tax=Nocardia callitridis TaxID=648753 RepID=UPI0031F11DBD